MLKNLIAPDRKRTKDKHLQIDLDLTYITPNILAMAFPASGLESMWRNSIADVYKLLSMTHGRRNFRIWNLAERETDAKQLDFNVIWCPFPDHHPPPLYLLCKIVTSIAKWLYSLDNVVGVHCVGGKGRTGTIISSYLYYSEQFRTADSAIEFFAEKRSQKKLGVTQPSQRRYIKYFEWLVRGDPINTNPIKLYSVTVSPFSTKDSISLEVYDSPNLSEAKATCKLYDMSGPEIVFQINDDVIGDIYFRFLGKNVLGKRVAVFHIVLHSYFLREKEIVFYKKDLDALQRNNYPEDMKITIHFDKPESKENTPVLTQMKPYLKKFEDNRPKRRAVEALPPLKPNQLVHSNANNNTSDTPPNLESTELTNNSISCLRRPPINLRIKYKSWPNIPETFLPRKISRMDQYNFKRSLTEGDVNPHARLSWMNKIKPKKTSGTGDEIDRTRKPTVPLSLSTSSTGNRTIRFFDQVDDNPDPPDTPPSPPPKSVENHDHISRLKKKSLTSGQISLLPLHSLTDSAVELPSNSSSSSRTTHHEKSVTLSQLPLSSSSNSNNNHENSSHVSKYAIFKSRAYTISRKSRSRNTSKRKIISNKTTIEHSTIQTYSIDQSSPNEINPKKKPGGRLSNIKHQENVIAKLSLRWKKKTYRNLQDVGSPDNENPAPEIMESNTVKAQNLMEHSDMRKTHFAVENGERGENENTMEEEDSLKALENSTARITTLVEEDSEGKKRRTSVLDPQLIKLSGNTVRVRHLEDVWENSPAPSSSFSIHRPRHHAISPPPTIKWASATPPISPSSDEKLRPKFLREYTTQQEKLSE